MEQYIITIDSGTTNTRFTLVENGRILAQSQCRVGAADAAHEGKNSLLREAVRRENR